jgi:iron complex transport system permease protein
MLPLVFLLRSSVALSAAYGSVEIAPSIVFRVILRHLGKPLGIATAWDAPLGQGIDVIVWQMRLPRVIMAALSGGVFAAAGIFMQTLTQNPIADPYILGISAGASTGAVCAIIFGFLSFIPIYSIQISAFLGALLALSLVLFLTGRHPTPLRLILLGVGVSSFFTAVTAFVLQKAQNDSQLRSAMFWMLGSFSAADWQDLPVAFVLLLLAVILAFCLEKELDALLLGDFAATNIGVAVNRIKTLVALCSALIVAVVVSRVGVIGFIGLIVPHASRKLCGVRHRTLVSVAVLLGAIFMVWADTAARTFFRPEEIPVGILTAMIGAPVFIWIVRRGYSFGGQE